MLTTINVPGLVILGIIIIAIIVLVVRTTRKRALLFNEFISKNGYSLTNRADNLPDLESIFLAPAEHSSGASRFFTNIIEGIYNGRKFRAFSFQKNNMIGAQTGHHTFSAAILEVEHTNIWPSLFAYKAYGTDLNILTTERTKPIVISDEVNKLFSTSIPETSGNEVVAFLTPEKSDQLIEALGSSTKLMGVGHYDIIGFEFTPHKLYVYKLMFRNQEDIKQAMQAADAFFSVLGM